MLAKSLIRTTAKIPKYGVVDLVELKRIEDIVESIAKVLPAGTEQVRAEVRDSVRVILESTFARMNLVTREEFDGQTALLRRTREKLEELEVIVAAMENE